MTVQIQTPYNQYSANGATTVFPYTFRLLRASDLVVKVGGVVVSNYTVSGVGNPAGGSVTFAAAPAAGTLNVLVYRSIPFARIADYIVNGPFPAGTVNLDFDLIWQAIQNIASTSGGEIRLPYPEQAAELVSAAARLDRLLSFNSGTGAAEMSPFTVTQLASTIAAAYTGAAGPLDALSYVQGGTGALTTRTAQAKARERLSLRDYLTADGTFTAGGNASGTDNLAKMNQLLTYAASIGADIEDSGGQYYFSAGFTLPQGVRIHGAGKVHAPLYVGGTTDQGTIFLIEGQVGADCIKFQENASSAGLKNMSVFNVNTNAIRSVVSIVGHLYPCLDAKVEIASLRPTTGSGLLIDSSAAAPNFSTLWGDFFGVDIQIGDIGLSTEYSVAVGLKINGTSSVLTPNTNVFHGGNIQGLVAMVVDGAAAGSGPIGCAFHGTRFDSVYSTSVAPTFLADAANVVEFPPSDVYVYPCLTINRALGISFHGCYFEVAGMPGTFNDGVNGSHAVIGVVQVTSFSQAKRASFLGCVYNGCYVQDLGANTKIQPTNNGFDYDTTNKMHLHQRANAVQAIPTGVYTRVETPASVSGDGVFIEWDAGTNTATVRCTGIYLITGQVTFDGWFLPGTIATCQIVAGGVTSGGSVALAAETVAVPFSTQVTTIAQLFPGDTIAFDVFHNQGGSQDTDGTARNNYLCIAKL